MKIKPKDHLSCKLSLTNCRKLSTNNRCSSQTDSTPMYNSNDSNGILVRRPVSPQYSVIVKWTKPCHLNVKLAGSNPPTVISISHLAGLCLSQCLSWKWYTLLFHECWNWSIKIKDKSEQGLIKDHCLGNKHCVIPHVTFALIYVRNNRHCHTRIQFVTSELCMEALRWRAHKRTTAVIRWYFFASWAERILGTQAECHQNMCKLFTHPGTT